KFMCLWLRREKSAMLDSEVVRQDAHESIFFFFIAEDCIRDGHVTGVQTCALPIFRCAIQAASGRTAVAGCPPVLRATDMPTHSVLSHIKGQNARDSRFESWDAPPNSPPPELFTTNDTFSIAGFEWHG